MHIDFSKILIKKEICILTNENIVNSPLCFLIEVNRFLEIQVNNSIKRLLNCYKKMEM